MSRRSLIFLLLGLAAVLAVLPLPAFADPLIVSLPTLGVEAPTEPLGVLNGQLGVPSDPDNIGTYQLRGNLVLVGHVDWAGTPRVFAGLRTLHGGEPIQLSDGRAYHVLWVSTLPVGESDLSVIFTQGDDDFLTLITCTGPFSIAQHTYLERLAVRAVRDQP